MRTTVNIQDSLFEKAKKYSLKNGITLGSVFESALAYFLKDIEKTHDKSKFKLITAKGALVNPNIDLDRTSEILNENDEDFYRR